MNFILRIFILGSLALFAACEQKSAGEHDHDGHDHESNVEVGETQRLYDEVMQIHDEVMPKMDELYKAKTALQNRIANTPNILGAEKEELDSRIAQLDSASEGMMVWMRQFNPVPDSAGEDLARTYLQKEKEKVKKVKEDILRALEATK